MIGFLLCIKIKQFTYFLYSYWQIPEGNGSGVAWDEEGHIVTNYHGENEWKKYSFILIWNSGFTFFFLQISRYNASSIGSLH